MKSQPPKGVKEIGEVKCLCGAQMEPFTEGRETGWRCPTCKRKRPVVSSHRKNPTRWPESY
jgi:tRNA(Ile2) C34 agmatinyltransferase TiaS